jgi:tetratricopeptide (TPR) repeat protein
MLVKYGFLKKLVQSHFLAISLISIVIAATFSSTLSHEFVKFDDYHHLHENPAITNFSLDGLMKIWSEPYFGLYAPVTYTFWGAEYTFSKWLMGLHPGFPASPSPVIFHATNVLFHLLNALLVYWLLIQLGLRISSAAIGALVFAIHPVQVESVAWVSSFRDLLAAFWGLLYLNFTLKTFRNDSNLVNWLVVIRGLGLTVLLMLAILSKPSAIIFVAFAPLLLYLVGWRPQILSLFVMAIWSLLACIFTVVAKQIQPDASVDIIPVPWERIFLAIHSISFYARTILWPSALNPDYGLNSTYLLNIWRTLDLPLLAAAAIVITLGFIGWFAWNHNPWAIGLLLAVLGVAPYSGILIFNFQNVSIVADRYLYLPMIGVGLCFAAVTVGTKEKIFNPTRFIATGALIILLGILSYQQSFYWQNDETLFTRMTQLNHRSFYGYNGLGSVALLKGQNEIAITLLQKAVDLRDSYLPARYNLARALQAQGNYKDALKNYIHSINIDPLFIDSYRDLAGLLLLEGRIAEAKDTVDHGLQKCPSSADLYATKGDIARTQGLIEDSINAYLKAIALDPFHFRAHQYLGIVYATTHRGREATEQFEICFQLDPMRANREQLKQNLNGL